MAEAFLIVVAKSLGSILASYAQEQLLLSWGLDEQVQKLRRTMETINAFLRDVEEREGGTLTSHTNQLWVSNLCNAVYDADDVFDEIVTMAERKRLMEGNAFCREVKLFFSSSNPLITSFSHAIRIKSIRENLDEIAKDRRDFASGSRHLEVGMQVEYNYLSINVVGREDEKDMLMSMLFDSNVKENVCVIPIVGVGGLGKSTLASYVFNDEKVKTNFKHLHIWVPLLQGMSLGDVMQKIVDIASKQQNDKDSEWNKGTTSTQGSNLEDVMQKIFDISSKQQNNKDSEWNKGTTSTQGSNLEELKICLRRIFYRKKYILVLDNVWNKDIADWRYLETLLTLRAIHGSRILLTTRSPIIAKKMGSRNLLDLQPLGNDHSWSMLESIVFGNNGCDDPDLKKIGLQILPMCYNVPLAIRALANVLANNISVSFWSKFLSDSVSNLGSCSKVHDIMPILKLSYDYLRPSALKSCFSYCSLFPKGHEFDKNKLVSLWIAQGFVAPLHEGGHLSLEEEGAEYVDMLVYKGLLQDVPNDESHISRCKLHDLMYEISSSVSAGQCKILNANKEADIERNIRHVSINLQVDSSFKISPLQSVKQIRTLISTKKSYYGGLSTSHFNSLMQSFLCLRVLDLHNLGIVKLSEDIGKLIHLRYLDLSENAFERLPNSITSLYNLQYLNLISTKLTKLPKDMDKLVNLRHLLVDWQKTYFPSGFGKLRNLQKLDLFIAGFTRNGSESNCGRLSDLKCLNHLRGELRILIGFYKNIGSDAKEANLKGKKNIKRLSLDWQIARAWNDEDEMVLEYLQPHNQISDLTIQNYKGNKMPTWMSTTQITSSLQNLTALMMKTKWCCIDDEDEMVLEYLQPHNQISELSRACYDEDEMVLEYLQPHNQISELTIKNYRGNKMPTWMSTTQIMSSLQNLTSVTIRNCDYITHVASFSRLPFLKSLELFNLSVVEYIESIVDEYGSTSSATISSSSTVFNLRAVEYIESSVYEYGSTSSATISSSSTVFFPSLTKIDIDSLPNLKGWREHGEGNLFFPCVSEVSVGRCMKLESLPSCPNVKTLSLGDGELSLLNAWCALKSLRSLELKRCDKMKVLPRGIGHLTMLQSLWLSSCDELKAIPDWIGNLCSLSSLQIDWCKKLASLPEEMTKLTQLKRLSVYRCPQLQPRLKKNVGEDWHKIQHIQTKLITP